MKAKFIIILAAVMSALLGQAQTSDYASYIDQAWTCLDNGNCDAAQRNYNVYKTLSGSTNYNLERAIIDCRKGIKTARSNGNVSQKVEDGYVDLGLPSGTLWKDTNEDSGRFYTWDQAQSKFGTNMPSKEQLEELRRYCRLVKYLDDLMVVGRNGKRIKLPCAGCQKADGSYIKDYGYYWSSESSSDDKAWSFVANENIAIVGVANKSEAYPVRLVKSKQ